LEQRINEETFLFTIKKDEATGSLYIYGIDITERKQADEELIKTKDYLNNIIENSLDCIITTDSKGRINKVNKSFLKMLGCEREEVMGRRTLEFSPADEGTYKSTTGEWVQIKEKFFDDTKTMVSRLVTEGEIYNWESYYSREDKKVVPVEQSIVYLHNDEGDKIGAVGIIRDITERKQAEEEKARIDARLLDKVTELSIMNEISEVLLSTRELNEILHMILIGATANQALGFNRAFLFLINEKENTLEGKVATGSLSVEEDYKIWERLVHERHSLKELIKSRHGELSKEDEPINNLVRQIKLPLKGTESIFSQAVYEKKSFNIINGRQNPLIDRGITNLLEIDALALVPLLSRGKPLGVLLADNFINKKPINDEDVKHLRSFANHASLAIENSHLYRSLEEKVEELSDANNELRENRDKLIRYERLSAVGEIAAQITHEIKNPLVSIGGFARRILKKDQDGGVNRNYAKIIVKEVDHLENILTEILYFAKPAVPKFDTIDLNSIIKSTLEVLHSEIEKNNISIEEHLDFNLPILWIDKNQIKRVLINLVKNAIQAMPDGGTITVSTINERQWVRVEIADTGVGIPEDDLDKLFDAFFTSKSTGSGLGLTISAQIVNNHGGTIEVHNRIPKGTIFTIKLPVKAPS
jgi:signal transduction histidine kinase/PAS domain-containing protein